MTFGLRCWDAAGNITLDTTDFIYRVHSIHVITTPNTGGPDPQAGYIYDPAITNNGRWIAIAPHRWVCTVEEGRVLWWAYENGPTDPDTARIVIMTCE